ncbi:MAG: hypothetical protein ACR2KS_05905 [Candidatus Eremiobacter antarcticus]|nr:FecR domain-containing protein [Candidatus Eremiobacteraeota bacterium]MBC5807077.1 FecR domain-containing protein [Candidatus Eremiobacteraeota bacterium]
MDRSIRCLAWVCLLLVLWPNLAMSAVSSVGAGGTRVATALPAVPVVTNVAGTVGVRTANGASRDIVSSQVLHSGDLLMTGINSLAVVNYADAGRVRLGPATTTTASLSGGTLLFHVASGSLCVEGQRPAIKVESGSVSMVLAPDTVFNVLKAGKTTKLAVFRGQVTASVHGKNPRVLKFGDAAVSPNDDALGSVPIDTLMPGFAPLKCPDVTTIARAVPSPVPTPVVAEPAGGGGGGGGAGILGILLGLAALGALAGGHGGGGGGGGGPSVQPTFVPPPSPTPTPTPAPGSVVVTPSTLSFSDVGSGSAKTFTVSEANYTGSFTVDASSCTGGGTATVSPTSGSSSTTFTVTPQGAGSCTITVSGSPGQSAPVTVNVGPFGAVAPSSTVLNFGDVGAGAAQTFTVSESGYTGGFSIDASQCAGAATVSPQSGNAGTTFTVTPADDEPSPCNVVVTDDHGQSATIVVNVGPFGAPTAVPDNFFFIEGDPGQPFIVTETGYTGDLTVDQSDCAGTASVSPLSGPPGTSFIVTPVAAGPKCNIVVSDHLGQTVTIAVRVFASPVKMSVSTAALSFNGAADSPKTFTATSQADESDHDKLTATSSDSSIISVSPRTRNASGPVNFSVRPLKNGSAYVTVTDDAGGKAFVGVTVGPSSLGVSRHVMNRRKATNAPKARPSSSPLPKTKAKAPQPVERQPLQTVREGNVRPLGPPNGRATAPVLRPQPGILAVSMRNIVLKAASTPQTVSVSETNYNGRLQAVSSNAGVVAVAQSTELGPFITLTIQPRAAGIAQIIVTDDHGGSQTISVNVLAPPPLRLQPRPRPGGGPARPL